MRPLTRPFAFLCLLLASCAGESPDAPFAEYLARLSRTLETDIPAPAETAARLRLPRPGALRVAVPADRLGALDFLELYGCELQVTIGKRNSSLGRMAKDSQRLLLELEFLRLAPACIGLLRARDASELADQLEEARQHKRAQLPARIFNATLGGPEYRALWREPPPAADYPDHTSLAVADALAAIDALAARWLDGDFRADNLGFELLLAEVAKGDAGQLRAALARQAGWLARADALLAAREARGPLCPAQRRPAAAGIMPNVVRRFFIDGIQPRAADLDQRYHALLPPVTALEDRLRGVLPASYRQWREQRERQLADSAAAPKRHVAAIQSLLRPCGGT